VADRDFRRSGAKVFNPFKELPPCDRPLRLLTDLQREVTLLHAALRTHCDGEPSPNTGW
jgi:hypothetical protein